MSKRWILYANMFAVFAQPLTVVDFPIAGSACPSGGALPPLVYLSQVMPGPCNNALQLQNVIFQIGQAGMLVIDKPCTLTAGIRLPSRFTLKGLGLGSASALIFRNDGIAISACQEQPRGYINIRDIDIYGPYAAGLPGAHSTGIALANLSIISVDNVRLSDFHTGLSGVRTYSVLVNGSNISNNRATNIAIGYESHGWRIRDSIISQSGGWGINVLGPGDAEAYRDAQGFLINSSNDLLLDGLRMESNAQAAVRTNAYGTRIVNSRFEQNGTANPATPSRGILVAAGAEETRILTNIFSSDCIANYGATTQRAFNMPSALNVQQCR